MAENKTGAVKSAPFKPEKLTVEQQELVVEHYIGIHPKYFWYRGASIDVDQYKLSRDGISWTGFIGERYKPK